jgi:hypothetical protein
LLLGVLMRAFIEQLWIDLHEELHGIVYHSMYRSSVRG